MPFSWTDLTSTAGRRRPLRPASSGDKKPAFDKHSRIEAGRVCDHVLTAANSPHARAASSNLVLTSPSIPSQSTIVGGLEPRWPGIRPEPWAVNRPKVEQTTDHPDQGARRRRAVGLGAGVVPSGIGRRSTWLSPRFTGQHRSVAGTFIDLPFYFID